MQIIKAQEFDDSLKNTKDIVEMSSQELKDLLVSGDVIIKPVYPEDSEYNYYANIAQDAVLRKCMGIGIKAYIEGNMDCISETHILTIEDVKKFLKDLKR